MIKNNALIILMTLIIACSKIVNINFQKVEDNTSKDNQSTIITDQNLVKSEMTKTDYEIATILFSSYFEENFDENRITDASYDKEDKEYSCRYVSKIYNSIYEKDYVDIRTGDFITYHFTSVENESKDGDYYPYSWNSTYTQISNDQKNKIIDLAQKEGYHTEKNLSNNEFEQILDIIFENDNKNLKTTIEKNNYTLRNYYLSENIIHFLFTQENNEENYIEIYSSPSEIMWWNVYGCSDKSIYTDSYYSDIFEEYIIDFDIDIQKNLDKLEKIYTPSI